MTSDAQYHVTVDAAKLDTLEQSCMEALLDGREMSLHPCELLALVKILKVDRTVGFASGKSVEMPFRLE